MRLKSRLKAETVCELLAILSMELQTAGADTFVLNIRYFLFNICIDMAVCEVCDIT